MYVDDYRKLGVQVRKNIYRTYANIFENLTLLANESIRDRLTGMIFEDENSVFAFKLYRPANFQDVRLTYEPIEINRIGKNKKTSIPVKVFGITSGLNFNLIDSQIYDVDIYDSQSLVDYEVVFDSNSNL